MKKLLSVILIAAMLAAFLPVFPASAAAAPAGDNAVQTVGIGGGGAFFTPLADPTEPGSYYVTCDMGGLYHTSDAGRSWSRAESRVWLREAAIADDGTVFCGAYGLFASFDKGETLERIYPKTVKHTVSRCGWPEELLLADGYNNGYVKCIAPKNGRVYFITLDWYGEARLVSCAYDGSAVTEYRTWQTDIYDDPASGVTCRMVAEDGFLLYTFGSVLIKYDLLSGASETVYTASGTLSDLEKIGDCYFLLDTAGTSTAILYSSDLENWSDLSTRNTLDPSYTKWGVTYTVDWIFNDICGNSFDSIFVSYNSDDGDGVLRFDGTDFHYVLDKYHKDRSYYGIDGWSYGCYGPFYGICSVPGDGSKCIAATIETVYELDFGSETECSADSLHCVSYGNGTWSTTGLNVQTAYNVYEDPFDSGHIIICTTDMGLQISYDGGETWRRHSITDHWDLQNTCYDLYFDTETQGKVYALWSSRHDAPYAGYTSDKVWTEGAFAVSCDGGMTWDFDNYSSGLPADSIPVKMAVRDDGDELTIAVACFNYGFYISRDSGRTFTPISGGMEDYQGFIWGEDVVIDGNTVYCLTSWHRNGGNTPGRLYAYDLSSGNTSEIALGDIVIPRSLTFDAENGLYLNVVPYYRYEWKSEWNDGSFVNYGGGVYHYENGSFTQVFQDEYGVFNSAFGPDGTLYIASLTGAVYAMKDGQASLYAGGLFPNLKNISFTGSDTMYVTSLGGGTYRMQVPGAETVPEYDGRTGASVYCWTPALMASGSYQEWSALFDELDITRVYQSIDIPYFSTGWVNETVARLAADGIETVLLTGDRSWGLEDCDLAGYKSLIDALAEYNALAAENERINAVGLDVETYTYSDWKHSPSAYFTAYIEKMREAYLYAHSNGLSVIQIIPVGYDDIDAGLFGTFVRECSDELSLMNYDKAGQLDSIGNEVSLSRTLGRRVESIFETMPYNEYYSVTESNTYFVEGYEALCTKRGQIEDLYGYDGLAFSYHHLPTVYHVVTGGYLAEIYAYTDEADPSRDQLWQPGALERIVLTGDNGDVITAGVYNPNLGAEYPETCFLAVGVKPGVTYTVSDPDGRYAISAVKTFSYADNELTDYTSISVRYTGETVHTHTPEVRGAVSATCAAEGYTGDTYCAACGELLETGTVIPAAAHEGVLSGAHAASCSEEGYTGDIVCSVCGEITEHGSVIPRTSHTEGVRNAREASCTSEGYSGDTVCLVCGKLLLQGSAVAKKPHIPGTAECGGDGSHSVFCTVCGTELSRVSCSDGNADWNCDVCGGRMPNAPVPVVYTKRTAFTEGKQYLILLSGKGFGADLAAETVTMNSVSGGYMPSGQVAPDMQWTYSAGKLSCELDGTVYYLKASASGSSAVLSVTENASQATAWTLSSGRLSCVVAVKSGKKTKNTTFCMTVSGNSVTLTSSKVKTTVVYEADS